MKKDKKLLGEDRRDKLIQLLKESRKPLTGSELAKIANVSRQIIVGDISILKAKKEPIMATSQGYIYLHERKAETYFERILACHHAPEAAEDELNILVDIGVIVKDVKVEHPIYGDIVASIMVQTRREVQQFLQKMKDANAVYLSELTNGIHLHTISATSSHLLDEAEAALLAAGYLVQDSE